MRVPNLKLLIASALALTIFVGGAYSVVRSVGHPAAEGTYRAATTGASSRMDWSDGMNAGFHQ